MKKSLKKHKWTDSEIQALLSLYAMEEIQCDFDTAYVTVAIKQKKDHKGP